MVPPDREDRPRKLQRGLRFWATLDHDATQTKQRPSEIDRPPPRKPFPQVNKALKRHSLFFFDRGPDSRSPFPNSVFSLIFSMALATGYSMPTLTILSSLDTFTDCASC